MKSRIKKTLLEIGVPAGNRGYAYTVELAMEFYRNPECKTLDAYRNVGSINKTSWEAIERGVRHSFAIARSKKGNPEAAAHYIGMMHTGVRDSVFHLLNVLEMEEKSEEDSND